MSTLRSTTKKTAANESFISQSDQTKENPLQAITRLKGGLNRQGSAGNLLANRLKPVGA
jgi:hypothetical protein